MSTADEPAPVREGDVLAGKYRVERVLGMGGMGVVVAATHLQLEQRVALKFLLPDAAAQPEIVQRFAREARAAAKILSEHVARVIDVGTLDSGSPYMVMEYLEGVDLAAHLEVHGPLPIADAATYVLQACEAIAEAHAAGIVHRDLKPANLFLARRPGRASIVKVLDFGISKSIAAGSQAAPQLTRTAALVGSPLYMSPEQLVAAKGVDARADLWALGVIVYELVTGSPPFVGDTMPQIVAMVLSTTHAPMRSHRPDVSEALDAVVTRCLAKAPADRFANVSELAVALAPFAPAREAEISVDRISRVLTGSAAPTTSTSPPTRASGAVATPPDASAWAGTQAGTLPGVRRHTGAIAVAALAALAVAAGAGYLLLSRGARPSAATSDAVIVAASSAPSSAVPPRDSAPVAPTAPAAPEAIERAALVPSSVPVASHSAAATRAPRATAAPRASATPVVSAVSAPPSAPPAPPTAPAPTPTKSDTLHPGLE